jgi:hypothetical protein
VNEDLRTKLIDSAIQLERAKMLIRDLAGADFDHFLLLRDEARIVLDYLEGEA